MRAAGLGSYRAKQVDVHDETVTVVWTQGDAQELLRSVRAALPEHNAVLVHDSESVVDPISHHDTKPSELIAWARTPEADTDPELARRIGYAVRDPEQLGTGDEGYYLDSYDVTHYGEPEALVILPRPEPWTAFAYLDPYGSWGSTPGRVVLAAARRWHERYSAVPSMVGLATGFAVGRRPADLAEAEALAIEHVAIAGLTAGTRTRAYARALLHLDQWCLYNRP